MKILDNNHLFLENNKYVGVSCGSAAPTYFAYFSKGVIQYE